MNRFDRAFKLVIGHEGGFTDDRQDRGNWTSGKIGIGTLKGTKYGVSAAAYPSLDIRNLSLASAKAIYRKDYWNRAGCDLLPDGVAYAQFDIAVNSGVDRATRILQEAVGAAPDGIIGPRTRRAIANADTARLVAEMLAQRIKFYMDLHHLTPRYGLGWSRRAVAVVLSAMDFARGQATPDAVVADDLLLAYMEHDDIETGSMKYKIAAALRGD